MGAAFRGNSRHGQTTETEHRVNSPGESGNPPCAFCRERNPGSGRGEAGGAPPTNASHLGVAQGGPAGGRDESYFGSYFGPMGRAKMAHRAPVR